MFKKLLLALSVLALFAFAVSAQDTPNGQGKTTIQHSTIKSTSAASGKEMYTSYCAVCHGADGQGGGPAANALKTPPANLAQLSRANGGKFPTLKVMSTINGSSDLTAHGSKEMPMWGPLFRSISNGHDGEVQQRVSNLSHYIESLQMK